MTEEASAILKSEAKAYKRHIRKTSREYYESVHQSLKHLRTNDPKEYWSVINRSTEATTDADDVTCTLNQFYEHFRSMNTDRAVSQDGLSSDPIHTAAPFDTSELDQAFTVQEIEVTAKKMKLGKACGIDDVVNEFLKFCNEPVLALLTRWFNIVLESGTVPEDWCTGIISPIYKKKGPRNCPDNYRGITLLSCVGKLFTAVLNKRLTSFIEQEKLIGPEQAGFRAMHSTMDHAFALRCILTFYLSNQRRVYAAFLDYRKAFDLVDRPSLWYKIINMGLNGKLLKVVQSIYASAKSCVRTKQGLSNEFASNAGVRQGENLSPLLFSLFIQDFNNYITSRCNTLGELSTQVNDSFHDLMDLAVLLYADDTVLLSETEGGLRKSLCATEEYCKKWKIEINAQKSKVVIFSRGKIRNIPLFTINGSPLEVVFEFVYLGLLFDYRNSFKKAITRQVGQSTRALHALLTKSSRLQLPPDVALHLFNHTITPILTYGCEVWAPDHTNMADVFHRSFIKKIFHLRKSTPSSMVYGEAGEQSISCKIDHRLLAFWYRLHFSQAGKLSTGLYRLMRHLFDTGKINCSWMQSVQDKLNNLGFGGLWLEPLGEAPHSLDWFKEAITLRLGDQFLQSWREQVWESSSCVLYRGIIDQPAINPTLCSLSISVMISIVRFRCGNMALPSNFYLHSDPLRDTQCHLCGDRLCDEFHLLLVCPALRAKRNLLLKIANHQNPNIIMFRKIVSSNDRTELNNLGKFLKEIDRVL
jgi:hypothetical protein